MTLTPVDAFGLGAFLFNVWGNVLLALKSERGWWLRIVSIFLWGVYGVAAASLPNVVNAVTFFGINCYGLWKWKRDRVRSKIDDAKRTRLDEALRWYAEGCPVPNRHPDDGDPTGYVFDHGERARAALGEAP